MFGVAKGFWLSRVTWSGLDRVNETGRSHAPHDILTSCPG